MTGEKTDTAEELADAAGIDIELVRDADESARYLSETMTQDKSDESEYIGPAPGEWKETNSSADEVFAMTEDYTTDVSELDVSEMKDALRRIHQQQERLAKETKTIESELIKRASETSTSD